MTNLCIFLLFYCLGFSFQRSTPHCRYVMVIHYIAAVVEYAVDRNVDNNLINYANLIQEAAQQVTEPVPGPIYNNPVDQDNIWMLTDPSLPAHVTRLLVEGPQEFTLVHRDVSCTFRVTLRRREGSTYYSYRAGAFSGVRTYSGFATGGTRICSVYACTGDEKDTCGHRFLVYSPNATAIFDELSIVGTMPTPVRSGELDADDSIVYAVSSSTFLMPLEVTEYTYTSTPDGNVTLHTMILNNHTAELYGFAIWGRRFATDGQDQDPPLVEEDSTTEAPTPGSAVVHLLSRVLVGYLVALVCYGQL